MILVVGGAGYIGSHVVKRLVETERVVVYDNLSTGCREAVNEQAIFIEGELADEKRLTQVFSLFPIKTVVHMAATNLEVESNENPQLYYENNITGTLVLLKVMRAHHVKNIIYSSIALTSALANDEQSYIERANPYARSKYFSEQILQDYTKAYQMKCIVLRYLNVASTQMEPLMNAFKLALETVATNEQAFKIYNVGDGQAYSGNSNEKENSTMSDRPLEDTSLFMVNLKKIQQELGLYAEKNLQPLISDAWNGQHNKNFNF